MYKQVIIGLFIILSIILYLYGYNISHYIYNQYDYPIGSIKYKETAKNFWDLRFSIYSCIICIVYFIAQSNLCSVNTMLVRIGFNLALISSIDKLILKEYSFSNYDSYIIIFVIIVEIINFKFKKHD